MDFTKSFGVLEIGALGRISFVLDASESAAAQRHEAIVLVSQVLTALPADLDCQIFFLGNASPHSPVDFARCAADWFEANRRRASLATPALRHLDPTDTWTVVFVGDGQIFDLEDWADSPLLHHALLVRLTETVPALPPSIRQLPGPSPEVLTREIYDPVIAVQISGPGFLPFSWNNSAYHLRLVKDQPELVSERAEDYCLSVCYWTERGASATATLQRLHGRQDRLALRRCAPPSGSAAVATGWLTEREVAAFRRASKRERFRCPLPGHDHELEWNALFCERDPGFGRPVYPSLPSGADGGFVLLKEKERGIGFERHALPVLELEQGRVAIKESSRTVVVLRYSEKRARWEREPAPLAPYHLKERDYVLGL